MDELQIGSVRMTERYVHSDPPSAEDERALTGAIDSAIDATQWNFQPAKMVGIAGTVTTICAVALGMTEYDAAIVHGHVLARAEIERVVELFRSRTTAGQQAPGLLEGRADVIYAGAAMILLRVMNRFDASAVIVAIKACAGAWSGARPSGSARLGERGSFAPHANVPRTGSADARDHAGGTGDDQGGADRCGSARITPATQVRRKRPDRPCVRADCAVDSARQALLGAGLRHLHGAATSLAHRINPRTKSAMTIPAMRTVGFRAAPQLKKGTLIGSAHPHEPIVPRTNSFHAQAVAGDFADPRAGLRSGFALRRPGRQRDVRRRRSRAPGPRPRRRV